ncbi:MAG: glycosyltransferase [Lachnospiraceae bacterium]|nr:glycosyltransferase [Lachnospiraceae bacterium]
MYTGKDHTFVICAYKENPYLEKTVKTIIGQSVKSNLLISTSTDNHHIREIAKKYQIPMIVNPVPHLAGDDWNYGYDHAKTELVTIAHQDDLYEKNFLEETLKVLNSDKNLILTFTDYYELKKGEKVFSNCLLNIKRLINFPLRFPIFWNSKFIRRRTLSVGCAICCPAVTFVKKNAGKSIFDTTFRNSCDYKTWVNLSRKKGGFAYIPKKLIAHRIYAESATTLNLSENIRQKEDYKILCELWPNCIAKMINKIYALSEKSNEV